MGKKKHVKGKKIYTKCHKCGIDIVSWDNLEPVCTNCAIFKGSRKQNTGS